MTRYLGAFSIVAVVILVVLRILMLRRRGIRALFFGTDSRSDFLLPPFALFYFYLIVAGTFHLPTPARANLFESAASEWIGAGICLAAMIFFLATLISFGRSFRVGIDSTKPAGLITRGTFAISRNPIYTAFIAVLTGEFLVFRNWIFLVYLILGFVVIHRQVLKEEAFLRSHYGEEYTAYLGRVRRYL